VHAALENALAKLPRPARQSEPVRASSSLAAQGVLSAAEEAQEARLALEHVIVPCTLALLQQRKSSLAATVS
jgi:hypothetical protein